MKMESRAMGNMGAVRDGLSQCQPVFNALSGRLPSHAAYHFIPTLALLRNILLPLVEALCSINLNHV